MAEKKKKPDTVSVYDERDRSHKEYPAQPGFFDTVKEGFENPVTRANINAARDAYERRKKKY